MSIKYKIISALIFIVIIIALPLSFYLLNKKKNDEISRLIEDGQRNVRMYALSTKSILIMNGGEILPSRLDSEDILDTFKPLLDDGLLLADSFLLSGSKARNGLLISRLSAPDRKKQKQLPLIEERLTANKIQEMLSQDTKKIQCLTDEKSECYRFISSCSWRKKERFCLVRMVVSLEPVLKKIASVEQLIWLVTATIILAAIILGLGITQLITNPIARLFHGVERVAEGDLSYQVDVKSHDEIGKLAKAFNNMSHRLLQSDRLKDEFLANTSHELRTPLNGIINLAESLIDGVGGQPSVIAAANLDLIVSSGKRLSSLVNDILDFSKLKNVELNLNYAAVDLYSQVSIALKLASSLLKGKNISMENRLNPDLPPVWGDENRIQQVLLNLTGNAVKFTEQGIIKVSSELINNYAVICIEDSGIGIPADKQESIFLAFEQADGSASRIYQGTGLGLTISRQLVELHGGKIWLESRVNQGSKVFFTLPLSKEILKPVPLSHRQDKQPSVHILPGPNGNNPQTALSANNDKNPKKDGECIAQIMIVDDDPINIQVLENHLGLKKYQVVSCFNGMEALALLEKELKYDLVILDVMMPRMSGFEVASKIREKYQSDQLPIIMLTAKNLVPDIVTGFESGADDYLTKPFDKKELMARVENLLRLKQAIQAQRNLALIDKELEISAVVQKTILTSQKECSAWQDLEIDLVYRPMNGRIGGDYFNIQKVDGEFYSLNLTDATGHGITAAMNIMQYDVINKHTIALLAPEKRHAYINEYLLKYAAADTHFISYMKNFYTSVIINIYQDRIVYSKAGNPEQYLIRKKNKELKRLAGRGRMLGLTDESEYHSQEEPIENGDLLILFTDGVFEQLNEERKKFGENRLAAMVQEMIEDGTIFEKKISEINQVILTPVEKHYQNVGLTDDLTLITIRILR